MSYLASDSLFPEWKIWTQFLDESTEGLRLDGLEESHPIEVCPSRQKFLVGLKACFLFSYLLFSFFYFPVFGVNIFIFPGGDKSCW